MHAPMVVIVGMALVLAAFGPADILFSTPSQRVDAHRSTVDGDAKRRGGMGGMRRPPREAVEACRAAAEGDTCSFQGRRGRKVTGTCRSGPMGNRLACRPNRRPGQR